MRIIKSILFLIPMVLGCSPWKQLQVSQGDELVAIKNAILDFKHTDTKFYEADSVFSVKIKDMENGSLGVSFFGALNKFIVIVEEESDESVFPTRYYEVDNKLFYWRDEDFDLTQEVLEKLVKYNQIDTLNSIGDDVSILDHSKPSLQYYFCRENLLEYKKVKTQKALGHYDAPSLNCN